MWKNLTILSLQHFGHFTNPCNIDVATNTRLLKFLATFLLQKSRSLQHYLMLQGKMSMLQKKTYDPLPKNITVVKLKQLTLHTSAQ